MNVEIIHNTEKNGIEVKFTTKPESKVLNWLKSKGFRWSGLKKIWYGTYSENLFKTVKESLESKSFQVVTGPKTSKPATEKKDGQVLPINTELEILELEAEALRIKLLLLNGLSGAEKFSNLTYIDRKQIITRPDIFQGRLAAFAEETVDKIVREGYDKSQDPIIVWKDPESKKYVVISGHSRWEASNILHKKGDKSLQKMPVKVFQGDQEAAIDYAVLESNRSGTQEGLKSDIRAYKRAVNQGYNRERLKGIFKPESRLRLLQDLAYLDESGEFVKYLDTPEEKSFPFLQRNAQWTGIIRKLYPQLTDQHEKEMFRYMYGLDGNKKTFAKKEDFFNLIESKVSKIDFDSSKPLNLRNVVSTSALTDPIKEQIQELEREIDQLNKERLKKEQMIVQARKDKKSKLVNQFQDRISEINKIVLRILDKKSKLEAGMKKVENSATFDLFSSAPEPLKKSKKESDLELLELEAEALKVKLTLLKIVA